MSFLSRFFGLGGTTKDKLIKNLVKERIGSNPMANSMGFDKNMVDSLTDIQLASLPEATIVTIVETWASLRKQGIPEENILGAIEAHRSSLGDAGDMPSPLTLPNYIKYRIGLEHQHGAPIKEEFINYAISTAKKAFL
jgi:hypothetical protein